MLDRMDDTIVAISTAPGVSALGVVRLSGPRAVPLAEGILAQQGEGALDSLPGSSRTRHEIAMSGGGRVPCDIYLFRAPRSYTRQDIVEVHTIGSPVLLDMLVRMLVAGGARRAEPGEFTARAFLNGAMDLATAEGVAGVIAAQTDTQLRAARRVMDGALSREVKAARDELAELVALVEAGIDFADEPIEFISPGDIGARLAGIRETLQGLSREPPASENVDPRPRVLLLGRPNAGKSSLMNRLSGTNRSLCSPEPGTTRDILSAPISLPTGDAVLLDAAGIDATEDELLQRACALARGEAERVDLICLVADVTALRSPGDVDHHIDSLLAGLDRRRVVIALNKIDACDAAAAEVIRAGLFARTSEAVCPVSAWSGQGVEELRTRFGRALSGRDTSVLVEASGLSDRQRRAIRDAEDAMRRAMELAEGAASTLDVADTLAFELRDAMSHLGCLTGDVATEELLGRVFARFCIGK